MIFFLIHDTKPEGVIEVEAKDVNDDAYAMVHAYNKKGYGVFFCPNLPSTPCPNKNKILRQASFVTDKDIRYWYIDIDEGDKLDQLKAIMKGPLLPSRINESKKGYHVYWKADIATTHNFSKVENRLIEYYGADIKAKDVVRLLRYPDFYHMKDITEPFRIKKVHVDLDRVYTETEMLHSYPMSSKEKRTLKISDKQICTRYMGDVRGEKIWEKIKSFNQGELLMRLSGTGFVRGEVYELVPQSNGNKNLMVDGKSSGVFINLNGDIVADSGYSNNIINWLKWPDYRWSWPDIMGILKEVVPEINA